MKAKLVPLIVLSWFCVLHCWTLPVAAQSLPTTEQHSSARKKDTNYQVDTLGESASEAVADQPHARKTETIYSSPPTSEWLQYRRTNGRHGFSPLKQITPANAKDLEPIWSFSTGLTKGHEVVPVYHDGILFIVASYDEVFALDARSGKFLWRYDRHIPDKALSVVCCDVVNKNGVFYGDNFYIVTADAHLVALNSKTGAIVWDTKLSDSADGVTIANAPHVENGIIISAMRGGKFGADGQIAVNAETGKIAWITYGVPGPGEPGNDTWGGNENSRHSGGTTWTATSGGVAFGGGIATRDFFALDANTGKTLYKFRTDSGMVGAPITYELDRVQYVAAVAGSGNAAPDRDVNNFEGMRSQNVYQDGKVWVFALAKEKSSRSSTGGLKPIANATGKQASEYSPGEELEAWKKTLSNGKIEYKVPGSMLAQKMSTVMVHIHGYQDTQDQTIPDATGRDTLKVSSWMKVELLAPMNPGEFTIVSQGNDAIQFIPNDGRAIWMWTVTPTYKAKDQKLLIRVSLVHRRKNVDLYDLLEEKTYPVDVDVQDIVVTVKQNFWTDPLAWIKYMLPGGAGCGVAVAVIAWLKKRKSGTARG